MFKIIMSESSGYAIEDTIIGAIAQSQDIGSLVDTLLLDTYKLRNLYVGYEDAFGDKELFMIYLFTFFGDSDYCAFTNNDILYNNVDLLSDCYDITILIDNHESDCFIKVVNKKKETNEMINDFLSEFSNQKGK